MIFILEAIVLCVLFTLMMIMMAKDPIKTLYLKLRTPDFTKKFRIFLFMRVFENTSSCPCPLMNRRNR